MTIVNYCKVVSLILIGAFHSISLATDAPEVLATKAFERGTGEYAAFPTLYHDIHGRAVLKFTGRQQVSHVQSGGIHYIYTSENCGQTWQRVDSALPPAVQYTGTPNHYRQIASGGWRLVAPGEKLPAGAIVRSEGANQFYARGLFLLSSQDSGKNWSRQSVLAPEHVILMNHHIGSQLLSSSGTYLAALYIKTRENATDQVIIVRQGVKQDPSAIVIPGLGDKNLIDGNETALSQTPDGRIVAFIRPDPDKLNRLLIATSKDDGLSWSEPVLSELTGYPPQVTISGDDILLTTAERRAIPLSIQVYRLNSRTLELKSSHTLAREFTLRPSDFGYPITLQCHSGALTAYYRPHSDGGAEVVAIKWK